MTILVAAGLLALALTSSWLADPVVVLLFGLLAMVGSFFLFGLAAGLIQFGTDGGTSSTLRAVADRVDDALLLTDRDGAIVFANARYRSFVGCHRTGEPRSLETALAGEPHAAECLFRLIRAAERGESRNEEFHVRDLGAKGAGGCWLRVSVRPADERRAASSAAGALAGATLWQITDVSARKSREHDVVRELEHRIAGYEALPLGYFTATDDGRLLSMNTTLATWLGMSRDAVVSRELQLGDVIAGGGEAVLRVHAARAAGQSVRLDLDLAREDGGALPAEVVVCLHDDGRGHREFKAVVLPRRDEGVATAEGDGGEVRYTRLFQSAPFGIATLDQHGRILTSNTAFVRMFEKAGLADAQEIGTLIQATGDTGAEAAISLAIAEARNGRMVGAPIEISFGGERQHTCRLYVSPVSRGQRQDEVALLYVIDATEQKALELKYAQSSKMEAVGKLAGGIAHDFNNVLTAIIGFSDLLLQMHKPTDAAHKDIVNIKKNANRAAGMVKQLLAFSRRQTLMPEVLDLGEVLSDDGNLLKRYVGEKVELRVASGRDLWLVKADRSQLFQVMTNLVVNARDAMPDGGKLSIRVHNVSEREAQRLKHQAIVPAEYVSIEVEDTGTGMTPEVMSKIFEPFFSTKDIGKGTGLGLSTVYGIVKQTGGYIFPESTPGKGTIFRIYLPRHIPEPAQSAAPAPAKRKEKTGDLTGSGRVLLVEDEDSVRNFAVRALRRQGYEVIEACTGAEALEIMDAETKPIDIVVSDVVMPEMDGPTMFNELRKTKPDLKVIFVSGYPDDRFSTSLEPGARFAFLQKPFTLPQLAAKVKEELAR